MFQTTIFKVNDMHCASCPKIIQISLEENPGVQSVQASLESKEITVTFDPSQVSVGDLTQIVRDVGYTPEIITKLA